MGMPTDVPVIDLMMNIPGSDNRSWYEFMMPLFLDEDSRNFSKIPVEYMFRNVPDAGSRDDYIAYTVELMDHHNIGSAMLGIDGPNGTNADAIRRYPDRFFASYGANPNNGMDEVRKIVALHRDHNLKAVTGFPSGLCPQVPINDKKWYPIYAKCVELDIPICMCAGVPGPRLPMAPQKVELIDEVCWFFPELKFVIRHGAEPWEALAVKLMLKYKNLYYMTSGFAPKYYPKAIIDYANSRGRHKIMYAGYFPMGLSLERIFTELPTVPFSDRVWPLFLRENARTVFALT
ncbi:MAG: putative TIM-barrel fold metal-dependent hydrolase [Myxococcota bacterium]|jgi:predicted TIM-barrel fold metal-dependent hydrolase